MIAALRVARGTVTLLIFLATGGGFLCSEAGSRLAALQKHLTNSIERRRAGGVRG